MKFYHVVKVGYEYDDCNYYTPEHGEFESIYRTYLTQQEAQTNLANLEFQEWKNSFTRWGTPFDYMGEEGPFEEIVKVVNREHPHIQIKNDYPCMAKCPADGDLKILIEYFGPLFYKIITSELGS